MHLYRIPEGWVLSAHILRHVLGGLMVALHCWTSWSTYIVLGEFGWFYGDFFPIVATPHLSYTGIYRYLNDPEKIVGQAAYFGLALIAYSPHVLALALLAFATNTLFLEYVEGPHMRRVYGCQVRDESGVSKNVKRVPGVVFVEQIGQWMLNIFQRIERHVYLRLEKIVRRQAQPCHAVGGIRLQKTLLKMTEAIPFVLDSPSKGSHICVLKDGMVIAQISSVMGSGGVYSGVNNSAKSDLRKSEKNGVRNDLKDSVTGDRNLKNNTLTNNRLKKSNSAVNIALMRDASFVSNNSSADSISSLGSSIGSVLDSSLDSLSSSSLISPLSVPWMTGTFQLSTTDCISEPFTITLPEYNPAVLEQMNDLLQSVSLTLDELTNLAADHPVFERLAEAIDSLYDVNLAPMTIFRLCSDPTRLQAHIATARDIFANV
ncbi:Phosphatidylethanolamine N-methyltransferase [Paramicrosporidium saccamoebae]|uniref:Phosphatidylethanolamine N-methyltransferase n=1 Tax=Paramicrosporidium saccamoebae TaxID=1246581 RepID=A0A2H9TKG1_9FUNG|nr:Phosphatidylethanolamine N-methyltransferase [Paramicrosporidium saccamoebae]